MKKLLFLAAFLFAYPASAADINLGMQALGKGDYPTAVNNLQPLALEGNTEAAYRMCGLYYLGQGVQKNDVEAAKFCRLAAERGHTDAQYNLALFYQQGTGVPQNTSEAMRLYSAAAATGHNDAKFNLAQLQTKNLSPAAIAAAGAGAPPITVPLNSPPPPPSSAPPSEWLAAGTKAEVVEETMAQREAIALASAPPSQPVAPPAPPAPVMAAPPPLPPMPPMPPVIQNQISAPAASNSAAIDINKYCLMAAQRGNPDPKCGKEYSNYLPEEPQRPVAPVAPLVAEAQPVSTAAPVAPAPPVMPTPPAPAPAAPPGYLDAPKPKVNAAETVTSTLVVNTTAPAPAIPASELQAVIPDLSKEPPLKHQNLQWFIDKANAGNAQAQNNLGVMHRRGINGATQDPKEAIRWFEHAASRGDTNAMMNLASMYRNGEGTKKNPELAYAWYNLAADRLEGGDAKNRAVENIQSLAKQLNNQQIGSALQYVTKLDEAIPAAKQN